MWKRILFAGFAGVVACGVSFYLAYFAGLMYEAAVRPVNSPNDFGLQAGLRHVALPVSLALGLLAFGLALLRSAKSRRNPPADASRPRVEKVV